MSAHRDWGSKTVKTKIVDWKIACHQPQVPSFRRFICCVFVGVPWFQCWYHKHWGPPVLVGGFNPFEKYARQIGSIPQVRMKIPKIFELAPPRVYLDVYTTYVSFVGKSSLLGFPNSNSQLGTQGFLGRWKNGPWPWVISILVTSRRIVVENHRRFLNWAKGWNSKNLPFLPPNKIHLTLEKKRFWIGNTIFLNMVGLLFVMLVFGWVNQRVPNQWLHFFSEFVFSSHENVQTTKKKQPPIYPPTR